MSTIAVDAMGGDSAPEEVVKGAILAKKEGVDVILSGDENLIKSYLGNEKIPVINYPQVISMDDDPAKAIRSNKDSSIIGALNLVKEKKADAVFSAGSTGATLIGAISVLGKIKGVTRPTIASVLPGKEKEVILVDSGANLEVKPKVLYQFAIMGSKLSELLFDIENPRIGLIALASDFMIERDFINVIKDREVDFFVNRIECYNPLTKENLIKMSNKVTEVTKDILPDQDIDCVVYGCTSGTIAAGYESIEKKVKAAKPMAEVTTPSTAAIKALKKLNINKISLFTPYSKKLNDEVLEYFKNEGFEVTSNSYFDIEADYDIGKVDQNYLYNVLSEIDLNGAEALFVSCTALPVLPIIDKLEKKLNTTVLSSNQALIWDTLVKINKNNSVEGFGKLFKEN